MGTIKQFIHQFKAPGRATRQCFVVDEEHHLGWWEILLKSPSPRVRGIRCRIKKKAPRENIETAYANIVKEHRANCANCQCSIIYAEEFWGPRNPREWAEYKEMRNKRPWVKNPHVAWKRLQKRKRRYDNWT